MAEGAPLLREYGLIPIEGSNPSLSAIFKRLGPFFGPSRLKIFWVGFERKNWVRIPMCRDAQVPWSTGKCENGLSLRHSTNKKGLEKGPSLQVKVRVSRAEET